MIKHVGDQCMKCGIGHFDVYNFVPDIKVATRSGCEDCPPEEHLHLACEKCGFMVWDKTAEQYALEMLESERAKLS